MVDVCWQCECGRREAFELNDVQVRVGNAVFRRPGCGNCNRPMMMTLDADHDPDGVGSAVRRPPGPNAPAIKLPLPV